MKRKHFIQSGILALGGTALTAAACSSSKTDDILGAGTIVHVVYFWLKEGLSAAEEKDFLGFFEALKKVEGIKSFNMGKPAPTTARPVVDNSFSYNIIVTFANMDDINTYEKHPDHLAAVEKYSKYWTKVEVKDTIL